MLTSPSRWTQAGPRDSASNGPGQSSSPFVGRTSELAELLSRLDALLRGEGGVVLVSGEAGIGKSRICWELAAAARERGITAYWGRCWEAGGAPAYWPWIEIIRQIVEAVDVPSLGLGPSAAYLAQLAPEIGSILSNVDPPPPPTDPESGRFFVFDAVASLLRSRSRLGPVVILVDDLHTADRTSLLLMDFLARMVADHGILLVGTYRDVEASVRSDLIEPIADLTRTSHRIRLGGLSVVDVRSLLEVSGRPPSMTLAERLHEVTDGNPFFLGEMLKLLSTAASSQASEPSFAAGGVPDGVREVVRRRLQRLPQDSIDLLRLAAVVGRDFEANVLRIASGGAMLDVLRALASPAKLGIVIESRASSGRFRFSHALVREVLYEAIDVDQRVRHHLDVARALEALSAIDPDRYVAELAHHFLAAAPSGCDGFVEHGRRAARRSVKQMALEEAVATLQRVHDSLIFLAPDEHLRCEILIELGQALEWANDGPRARAALEQAAAIARRIGDTGLLVRAALGIGEVPARKFTASSRCDAAPDLLLESLEAIQPDDFATRAQILGRLALHHLTIGERNEAIELSEQALIAARQSPDLEAVGGALVARHAVLFGPDELGERRSIADELLSIASRIGSKELATRGHAIRVTIGFETGDVLGIDVALERHGRLAEEAADPFELWANTVWRGARALLVGDLEGAERLAQRAHELGETVPGPHTDELYAPVSYVGQLILIGLARDDAVPLRDVAAHYASCFPEVSAWRVSEVAGHSRNRRIEETRRTLDLVARPGLAAFERNGTWLASLGYLSDAAALLGDRPRAQELYDLLLPFADRIGTVSVVGCYGPVAHALALLASTLDRWDEAEAHFRHAIAISERMGAPPHLAETLYEYARALQRRGELASATPLALRSSELALQVGLKGLSARCSALVSELSDQSNVPTNGIGTDAPVDIVLGLNRNVWIASLGHETVHLKDTKGLRYIAELIAHPGREIHATELIALFAVPPDPEHEQPRGTDADALLAMDAPHELADARARASYRRQLSSLGAELDGPIDPKRRLIVLQEMEGLRRELARVTGLGGRARRSSDAERARISVTRAIRLALTHVCDSSPRIGAELAKRIHTGTWCSYRTAANAPPDVPS